MRMNKGIVNMIYSAKRYRYDNGGICWKGRLHVLNQRTSPTTPNQRENYGLEH